MNKREARKSFIHLIFYSLLLIATPFILLKNFMQLAIGKLSEYSFQVMSLDIPIVVIAGLTLLLVLFLKHRKEISKYRIVVLLIIALLVILGQSSTDFYFNHKFYELQHNWHYLAYGILVYFAYSWLKNKGLPPNRIILFTFLIAATLSTFDEAVQVPLSTRIFDICDIAKDLWGTVIGLTFIYFYVEKGNILKGDRKIRQPKINEYLKSPFSLLVQIAIFTYILLFFGSLLSDRSYLTNAILISLGIYIIVFLIIHYSQFKKSRIFLLVIASVISIASVVSIIIHRDKKVIVSKNLPPQYYGIPIPYFDFMIHNNGFIRLVDKKSSFNKRDQRTIFKYSEDILIIGNGDNSKSIYGFHDDFNTQFTYNTLTKRGLQVIILETKEATLKYNELKKKGLNVLLIIHQK